MAWRVAVWEFCCFLSCMTWYKICVEWTPRALFTVVPRKGGFCLIKCFVAIFTEKTISDGPQALRYEKDFTIMPRFIHKRGLKIASLWLNFLWILITQQTKKTKHTNPLDRAWLCVFMCDAQVSNLVGISHFFTCKEDKNRNLNVFLDLCTSW